MRYIEGDALRQKMDRYRGRRDEAVALVVTLARAMSKAHDKGVLHRDLKPENIILDADGQPVIVDFGLALRCGDDATRLTQAGSIQGTVAYMAPEQQRGDLDAVGPACDIYSL